MSDESRSSRRVFLARSAQGALLLGAANTVIEMGNGDSAGAEPQSAGDAPGLRIVQRLGTGARRPRGLAVSPDDRWYIAADQGVLMFDRWGTSLGRISTDRPPRCVACLDSGDIAVGLAHHVEIYTPAGERTARWSSLGDQSLIGSLAADGRDLLIAEVSGGMVRRFDAAGNELGRIHLKGAHSPAPGNLSALAAANGQVYVANSRRFQVEAYRADGQFVSAWGGRSRDLAGFGGCCNPVSLALLPDGRFVTAERGVPRVKIYDALGRFEALIAGPEEFAANTQAADRDASGCAAGGLDVAIDSQQRVLVLDRATGEVSIVA